ncbi:hypothetical protein KI387_006200, partial [Taxus chinensis]
LEWPWTRVVYQVKVGPTTPQTSPAQMVPPIWPCLEDNRRPSNRCELGVPVGMPSGNLNSSRLVPPQPPQDDSNGDSSLDELLWAAAWLYKATHNQSYLNFVVENQGWSGIVSEFSSNNKFAGAQILLAQ